MAEHKNKGMLKVNYKKASDILSVHRNTIRNWIREGKLRTCQQGKRKPKVILTVKIIEELRKEK